MPVKLRPLVYSGLTAGLELTLLNRPAQFVLFCSVATFVWAGLLLRRRGAFARPPALQFRENLDPAVQTLGLSA